MFNPLCVSSFDVTLLCSLAIAVCVGHWPCVFLLCIQKDQGYQDEEQFSRISVLDACKQLKCYGSAYFGPVCHDHTQACDA